MRPEELSNGCCCLQPLPNSLLACLFFFPSPTATLSWREYVSVTLPEFNPPSPLRTNPHQPVPGPSMTPPHPAHRNLPTGPGSRTPGAPTGSRWESAQSGSLAAAVAAAAGGVVWSGGRGDAPSAQLQPPYGNAQLQGIARLTPPAPVEEAAEDDTWGYGEQLAAAGAAGAGPTAAGGAGAGGASRGGTPGARGAAGVSQGQGQGGEEEGQAGPDLFDMPAAPAHEYLSTGRRCVGSVRGWAGGSRDACELEADGALGVTPLDAMR